MSDPKKWWMISEESVVIISDALARLDESKPIMELDTGLHTTDCVPDDWKESCDNCTWVRPPDDCGLGSEPKLVRASRCSSYRRNEDE